MAYRTHLEKPIGSFAYAMLVPETEPPRWGWPMLLLLHDYASMGKNPASLLENPAMQALLEQAEHWPALMFCPQLPQGAFWDKANLERAMLLMNRMIQAYKANPKQVYVCGLGDGAHGVWKLLRMHTRVFTAAVLVGGGTDPIDAARVLSDFPLRHVHAKNDPTPVSFSRAIHDAFAGLPSHNYSYTETSDCEQAWQQAFGAETAAWLLSQSK